MPLNPLREKIDQIDRELIALLSERLKLVAEVGKVKSEHGIPVYAPDREKVMIEVRRQEAEKQGVPADLIEDVLRRVMRESYANENKHGFKQVNSKINKVVIVGGKGKLGRLFDRFFSLSSYQVAVLDREDWDNAATILSGADLYHS